VLAQIGFKFPFGERRIGEFGRAAGEVRAPQFGSAEGDLDAEMAAIAGAIITEQRGLIVLPCRRANAPNLSVALHAPRRDLQQPPDRHQYARIVHAWVESAGLDSSAYDTHSMRRTKAAEIYKKTGNLRAVQLLLGHTKLESTVRYLGIEVDDALSISEQVEL
jgi:integrase